MCVEFAVLVFLCISVAVSGVRQSTMMKTAATRRFVWLHAASEQQQFAAEDKRQAAACSAPCRVENGSISMRYTCHRPSVLLEHEIAVVLCARASHC